MAYCTLDDLEKLIPEVTLIQLTDDEDTGAVNTERVSEAIAQADSEVDGYAGTKYSVPFTTVPPVVKKCSVDIAVYNLYSRKVEEFPATRKDRYNNAIRFLEKVAKGEISLGLDPEPTAKSEGGAECNKTSDDRVFTRTTMEGF